jgi:glycosyltransferase involved in cell wall biosynthesis
MDHKIAINRTVTAHPFYMQPVEIIIPFHNRQEMITNLINDIYVTVSKNPYIITLVDDASRNTEFAKAIADKKMTNVRVIIHQKHRGFGAAVNNALLNPYSSNIKWVCVLHSDVRLKDPNWLYNLGVSMHEMKASGVKMVAPLTDNPGIGHPDLKAAKATDQSDKLLENDFLPLYCALAHRQLFNVVGLLPEYPYAGNEAEEYALAMKEKGFKQAICMSSWVHHEDRGTISQYDGSPRVQKILRKSREQFVIRTEKKHPETQNSLPE